MNNFRDLLFARAFQVVPGPLYNVVSQDLRESRGAVLREGLTVVLAGRPNVGKSSLLNRLAGEDVAIVTPVAGTTRDYVRATIVLEGVPIHLVDTAGLAMRATRSSASGSRAPGRPSRRRGRRCSSPTPVTPRGRRTPASSSACPRACRWRG